MVPDLRKAYNQIVKANYPGASAVFFSLFALLSRAQSGNKYFKLVCLLMAWKMNVSPNSD